MKIRTTIAVMAAKITGHVCKLMGRQGVTWAGKVAMKICPDILEELSSQVREKIFVVCGTNGKTTTNNMLCAGLEAEGKKVICNHTGSNMLNGVVAAFVLGAKFSGKLDADYACIEVDEASTRRCVHKDQTGLYGYDQSVPRSAGPLWRDRYHYEHPGRNDEKGSGYEGHCQW